MTLHLTQSKRLQILNDLIGFIVAFAALKISAKKDSPQDLSFGWQRSRLLGAFFNSFFLLALGVSIFLQSIERFASVQVVEQPKLVLIVGCIGLGLNMISASFLHGFYYDFNLRRPVTYLPFFLEHDHSHGGTQESTANAENGTEEVPALHHNHRRKNAQLSCKEYDLGMIGVLIHVVGDAANNVGVIISALVIWLTSSPARYYADPAVSMAIAVVILITSLPLVTNSGRILLESVPNGINLDDIKHDLELIPGVQSIHELHVWRLNQEKAVASVHVAIVSEPVSEFVKIAKIMNDCFHSYGIHSATVQPELGSPLASADANYQNNWSRLCQVKCGSSSCDVLNCCG
ncbi:uncharacterized protein N7496_007181 [Penicillium cataractarum]|uniref:Uncharacterized protein n=1 Tax=Penicillium cataractarum TaxID=2100454 RepID=A0A9W9S5N2_9EURO|nr:uncharacterized protein N7496_007181 [Penicillium cataractarum]KAJ5371089.1 hypothetical protein N7496_007181 [Penicillium cataractarum]